MRMQEQIQQLPQLIDTKLQLQRQLDQLNRFTTRREQIEKLQVRLQQFSATAALLRSEGMSTVPPGLAESISKLVGEFRAAYITSPDQALDKPFSQLKDKVEKILEPLERAQVEAWTSHVVGKLRGFSDELLIILQKIPAFTPTVNAVRGRVLALQQRNRTPPRSAAELEAFKQALQDIDAEWRKLGSDNVPKEVVSFLREAVSQQGAPLDLWTDSVRAWLVSNRLTSTFRIRLA
ncbi:hypothetical protein [Hyalangium gracile]|uniref:hypothetical protein n=1 Tax=Hyalangium gracile TaxID=394092 RepID=UPI001CCDC37B|nr:hypothetical protein [Hyalangium gracile]